jgi:hypothetical protein
MPSNQRLYSALLSSPRGIEQDREAVHRAVDEVNHFLKPDGLAVELRDWDIDELNALWTDFIAKLDEVIAAIQARLNS